MMKLNFEVFKAFSACLDEVQEELLYYPGVGIGGGIGVSKMLKFKFFYVMGKALSGELSCPCDRSCFVWFQNYFCMHIAQALSSCSWPFL